MTKMSPLFEAASREIVELHRFFVAWYDAASADATEFARCETAFGGDFHMIPPTGRIHDRAATIELIRANRASFNGDFSIAIEDIRPGWQSGDAIVVTYIEAQDRKSVASRRQASALFTSSSSAPSGVEWRHLHESWLQMPGTGLQA